MQQSNLRRSDATVFDADRLDHAIRRVPDFPKPGILFYDITSVLTAPVVFAECMNELAARIRAWEVDALIGIEARGFVFAAPLAIQLGLPLVLARKPGKLPGQTVSRTFQLEYGEDEVHVHRADLSAGSRLVIVDDLIATGGTVRAVAEIIRSVGALPVAVAALVGLPFLGYREVLRPMAVETLITYDSE